MRNGFLLRRKLHPSKTGRCTQYESELCSSIHDCLLQDVMTYHLPCIHQFFAPHAITEHLSNSLRFSSGTIVLHRKYTVTPIVPARRKRSNAPGGTYANYSSGGDLASVGWIFSHLAVQPGLGLLSQRRFGLGGGHSGNFAFNGKNIVRARVLSGRILPTRGLTKSQGDPAWEEGRSPSRRDLPQKILPTTR